MISILLALLAAVGAHPVTPSDVSGGPVSVAPQTRTVVAGRLAGAMHTSDVSGGPVSATHP
ncbi:MAG: hypothetical protein QOD51_118 [Candidatus Eremiobacteraeota bacterium]|jgi:hypothetical protein|nr:hypothetical protein [Candidatus Eremiobacteraeota bacterium]